ncbi:hypothetical protein WKI65_30785 [Streptomyces sp. MS1.AVA.3]|uniref:hypothetical protein n=1 Tax=Streptomyces decoyicus TaxID=249567 RepID=UPI0030C31F9D
MHSRRRRSSPCAVGTGSTPPQQLSEAITAARDLAAEGGRHPLLTEWMTAPSGAGMDEQFALSLAFLLDGIATRLPRGEGGATP